MNYYEHHIGDYDAATAHLTLVEDAIYSRLIRTYYRNESPLPADVAQVSRLIRARAEHETVLAILEEFFTLKSDGWHQSRCDSDIARYRDKSEKARASVARRWEKVRIGNDGNTNVSEPYVDGNAHQSPVSIHQEKKDQKKGAALSLPPWLPESVWADWHAFRNTRKGWTPKARALSLSTLAKLREQGHDPKAVVEQSIERGWTGLFPIRSESHAGRNQGGAISAAERVAAVNAEAERRQYAEVISGEFRNVG